MHRQSLGSPASKLHSHGEAKEETLTAEEPNRRDSVSSSLYDEDQDHDNNNKAGKSRRVSSSLPRTEKFIHLLPVLVLFCFLVLYLCSHTPSASDMASFGRFKRSPKHFAAEMNGIRRYISVESGDILATRSLRNLHEIEKQLPKSRPHRKFADF